MSDPLDDFAAEMTARITALLYEDEEPVTPRSILAAKVYQAQERWRVFEQSGVIVKDDDSILQVRKVERPTLLPAAPAEHD